MEKDHRLRKLAQNVLQNSVCLQPGEKIYIETSGTLTTDFLTVLIEETIRLGAVPFYYYNDTLLRNALLCNASELQIREHAKLHARIMEQMDAYVGIRCVDNPIDAAVPGMEQNTMFHRQYAKPVHFDIRIPKTKWCLLRYPTPVMAFQSNMSTEEFEDFYFITVYTPNSQSELARLDYRMKWEEDFLTYLKKLEETKPVIFCGDLNVAHTEIDLKNPKTNRKNAGFTDEERQKFTELLNAGFVDTFRYFYPEQTGIYSWWSYRFSARAKNAGWRIDYFCVSESLKDRLEDAKILTDIMGSDHCPVELDIK